MLPVSAFLLLLISLGSSAERHKSVKESSDDKNVSSKVVTHDISDFFEALRGDFSDKIFPEDLDDLAAADTKGEGSHQNALEDRAKEAYEIDSENKTPHTGLTVQGILPKNGTEKNDKNTSKDSNKKLASDEWTDQRMENVSNSEFGHNSKNAHETLRQDVDQVISSLIEPNKDQNDRRGGNANGGISESNSSKSQRLGLIDSNYLNEDEETYEDYEINVNSSRVVDEEYELSIFNETETLMSGPSTTGSANDSKNTNLPYKTFDFMRSVIDSIFSDSFPVQNVSKSSSVPQTTTNSSLLEVENDLENTGVKRETFSSNLNDQDKTTVSMDQVMLKSGSAEANGNGTDLIAADLTDSETDTIETSTNNETSFSKNDSANLDNFNENSTNISPVETESYKESSNAIADNSLVNEAANASDSFYTENVSDMSPITHYMSRVFENAIHLFKHNDSFFDNNTFFTDFNINETSEATDQDMEFLDMPPERESQDEIELYSTDKPLPYRFVFPEESTMNDTWLIKDQLLPVEEVLIDERGIPEECSKHIEKAQQHYSSIINELTSQIENLVYEHETKSNLSTRPFPQKMNITKGIFTHAQLAYGQTQEFSIFVDAFFNVISNASISKWIHFESLIERCPQPNVYPAGTIIMIRCDSEPSCKYSFEVAEVALDELTSTTHIPAIMLPDPAKLVSNPEMGHFQNEEAAAEIIVLPECDERCLEHGFCGPEGQCLCEEGWNGKYCSILGCPNDCSGNGHCKLEDSEWKCHCDSQFFGLSCQDEIELSCSNKSDDDNDGLTDCEDPDCCSVEPCKSGQYCAVVVSPESFINSSVITSDDEFPAFFDKFQFLIKPGSVQKYAMASHFNDRYVCVVRGRTVTKNGMAIPGVRISHDNDLMIGFTLSRLDGFFDFMGNCDSPLLTLKFGKSPFAFMSKTFKVSANQFLDIGDITLHLLDMEQKEHEQTVERCTDHLYMHQKPSFNVHEPQPHLEKEPIRGSPLDIVYSAQLSGRDVFVDIVLTNSSRMPKTLKFVHVKAQVEGQRLHKVLEAESNLTFSFTWNKQNVYGQWVYGLAVVHFEVGYEYTTCKEIVWTRQDVEVHGYEGRRKDGVLGWNLNLHHRLDPIHKMLYLGTGEVHDLKNEGHTLKELVMQTDKVKSEIGNVIALASGGPNTTFFGDDKYIYEWNGSELTQVLELNATSGVVQYYLLYDKVLDALYASLPAEKRVLRLLTGTDLQKGIDPKNFWITVAGNGKQCRHHYKSLESCGDKALATEASLIYPKGIAKDHDGRLYIADGRVIRFVDLDGIIYLKAGLANSLWRPNVGCQWQVAQEELNLQWPTEIGYSSNDKSLYILDSGDVIKVYQTGVAVPLMCGMLNKSSSDEIAKMTLVEGKGNLLLVTSNRNGDSNIIQLQNSGTSEVLISNIGSVAAVDTNFGDDILISKADKIFHLTLSRVQEDKNKIFVSWPLKNEVYIFDKSGLHQKTNALLTDSRILNFAYDKERRLTRVVNKKLSVVEIKHLSDGFAEIWINMELSCSMKANKNGLLATINHFNGHVTRFEYDQDLALIRRISDDKMSMFYENDARGNLAAIIGPTGIQVPKKNQNNCQNFELFNVSTNIFTVPMNAKKSGAAKVTIKSEMFPARSDPKEERTIFLPSQVVITEKETPGAARSFNWSHYYHLKSRNFDGIDGIGKHFLVNNNKVFSVERHPRSGIQALYDESGIQLVRFEQFYIPSRRHWIPIEQFKPVVESFDNKRRLTKWQWGNLTKSYKYDEDGRLLQINYGHQVTFYDYSENLENHFFPSSIRNVENDTFKLYHDPTGDLKKITLPDGDFSHTFKVIPLIGQLLVQHSAPWDNGRWTKVLYDGSNMFWKKIIRPDGSTLTPGDFGNEAINGKSATVSIKKQNKAVKSEETTISLSTSNSVDERTPEHSMFKTSLQWSCMDLLCYDYVVNCSVHNSNTGQHWRSPELLIRSDVVSKRPIQINDFVYESSYVSRLQRGIDSGIVFITELDDLARVKSRTYLIGSDLAMHENLEYNANNQISFKRQTLFPSKVSAVSYKYSKSGAILSIRSDLLSWDHEFDSNGNIVRADFGVGKTELEFDFGSRISKIAGKFSVKYDQRGNLIARHNYTFIYSDLDHLIEVRKHDKMVNRYIYDDQRRLIMQVKSRNEHIETLHYFYGYMSKPDLISHVYSDKYGFALLVYDHNDKLMAVEKAGREILLVISDANGTPEHVFDRGARLLNTIVRSPFGAVVHEDNENLFVPLGFHGGIDDHDSGVVILNGRAYDAHLGQWMNPDIATVLNGDLTLDFLEDIFAYRFRQNDPINPDSLKKIPKMNSFEQWMELFGIKTPQKHLNSLKDCPVMFNLFSSVDVEQEIDFSHEETRPQLGSSFWTGSQLFGPHVQIDFDTESAILITKAHSGAGTAEQVLSRIVNGTVLIGENINGVSLANLHLFRPPFLENNFPDLDRFKDVLRINMTKISATAQMLSITLEDVVLILWIGFDTEKDAKNAKVLYAFMFEEML